MDVNEYAEDRKLIMPYGIESAFHCQKCGGITDEYGKCYYCGSLNKIRYAPNTTVQMYIELDDEKKFYFNNFREIGAISEPETIDATCLMDNTKHYLRTKGSGEFSFSYWLTDDSVFKTTMINETTKPITINLVLSHMPMVYRFRTEYLISNMEITETGCAIAEASMNIHDLEGWTTPTLTAPDDARCPNCGAIVRKAYGCCDYCGGWVEYR